MLYSRIRLPFAGKFGRETTARRAALSCDASPEAVDQETLGAAQVQGRHSPVTSCRTALKYITTYTRAHDLPILCRRPTERRLLTPKTDMAEKDDDDAVAVALLISVVANQNKMKRKRNRNVFTQENQTKPITNVSVHHVLLKIDLKIEHILIGVKNRSPFRITHAPKISSDLRL